MMVCFCPDIQVVIEPILEYASTIWSSITPTTNITKLQSIQNTALRISTGCTLNTNIQHLHHETNIQYTHTLETSRITNEREIATSQQSHSLTYKEDRQTNIISNSTFTSAHH